MAEFFARVNAVIWGAPALLLILGVGIFLTIRLRFAQLTLFPSALREFLSKLRPGEKTSGVSPYQALCTALAATVGTGNLVGVAGAICLGGPGAVFWMWVCGLLGMVTKYAEATLAVRYRVKTENGYTGGPMYVMVNGLGRRWKPMATVYCLFGVVAAFGVGNAAQVNAAISGIREGVNRFGGTVSFHQTLLLGMLLAAFIGTMLFGGAKRIGTAAEALVPFAAGAYILLCVGVLVVKGEKLPQAFAMIFQGAFSPRSVTGGMLGSAFQALRIGCSRGVFTNEAGMGTAAIAHASAEVSHPVQQGLMGIMEVFLDTMVICTLTAFAILVSGVEIPYGTAAGSALTAKALESVWGGWVVTALTGCLCAFAFATILGWSLYAGRCMEYLFGKINWPVFALAQGFCVVLAAKLGGSGVWTLSELFNGLMAIPNLICLISLSPKIKSLTKDFYTGLSG